MTQQWRTALTLYRTEAGEDSGAFQGHLCSCTWTLWFCLETGHTQSFGKRQVWTPKPDANTGNVSDIFQKIDCVGFVFKSLL